MGNGNVRFFLLFLGLLNSLVNLYFLNSCLPGVQAMLITWKQIIYQYFILFS